MAGTRSSPGLVMVTMLPRALGESPSQAEICQVTTATSDTAQTSSPAS